MKYVLLMILLPVPGSHQHTVVKRLEFSTLEKCQKVSRVLQEEMESHVFVLRDSKFFCYEK